MNRKVQLDLVSEEIVEDFIEELRSEGETDPQVKALGVVQAENELRIILSVDGVVGTTNGERINGMLDFRQD